MKTRSSFVLACLPLQTFFQRLYSGAQVMEQMPILSGGNSHVPPNLTRTHTSRFCISLARRIHNVTSAQSRVPCADGSPWPPTAVPKVVSISLNYYVAWRSHCCKEPHQVPRQNVYLLYRSLSLIDMSREGRRVANSCHGLRHSACRCISPLIIYVMRLLFRHHPSSSQTTNVIAMLLRNIWTCRLV